MDSRFTVLIAMAIAVAAEFPCAALADTTLYVAPDGSDEATGRRAEPAEGSDEGPLASLPAAVHQARQIRQEQPEEPIEIEIAGGRYELSEPLRLTAADSGLTIRARQGSTPVLSGGRRIVGWEKSSEQPGLWTVVLDEVRDGSWYFHQLFVDGERTQRARTPNEGFFQAAGKLGEGSPIELPFKSGDLKAEWAGMPDARLIMLMKWTDLHVPIAAVDTEKNIAMLTGKPRSSWMDESDARYWVENVPDALDQPGEWYLDRESGRLSFLVSEGVDPNQAQVIAPRLREIVRIEGNAAAGKLVEGVRISGLTFSDTDYEMPAEGIMSPQAAVPIRGHFRIAHAIDGIVENCVFENLGGYAIELGRGTQRWHVVGNRVRSIGGGGLRVGEPGDRNPTEMDACHGNQVTDNELTQLGRVFAPACGVILFQSGSNRIAHNHIHDLFYTGISVGWNWGYRETPCRENVIEFNLVEKVGQGRLSDMGGIYTLGPQPGTVVRNNLFRDVKSYRYGGWGLYTDEGSSNIVMENNVAYRCTDAGFHQHYGRDNEVRNNLLAWNVNHSVMRTRDEPHRSFDFTRNVIIADSGTLLGSNWSGTTEQFLCDYNTWFDTRHGADVEKYRFADQSWAEWQGRGQGAHSQIADPLLVDPERPELGLQPESPAFELGFEQIDMSRVGPRPLGERE